jgi:spore coat polysaccharide biosynthesis predicted glycosyltransferase SpsG
MGMGHLFRAVHLSSFLRSRDEATRLFVNPHPPSEAVLSKNGVEFETVPLADLASGWESTLIEKYDVGVWIDDRRDTDIRHAERVKAAGSKLVTFDDRGSGAELADLHFAPLAFDEAEPLRGKTVRRGVDYLVLNPEIVRFRRLRRSAERLLVTLGGSDTYGVTLKVVEWLRGKRGSATVVTGPGFEGGDRLERALPGGFELKRAVPSLIEEFSRHDLAVTGGGVTPFEANACGLPCIVVANEEFEVPVGRYLARIGSSVFAGHWTRLDETALDRRLDIESMSRAGLDRIPTNGLDNILREIRAL